MNWSDVAATLGKLAPALGTLIGGPAGAAIGGLVASALGTEPTPDAVSQAIATNPDAAVKLRQIEADETLGLRKLVVDAAANQLAADTQRIQAINATMQSEAESDHWPTYSWRPFIGFVFGAMTLGCYFVLPLVHVTVPSVPESVWMSFGAILGVTAWFRGKMQADPSVPTDNRG